MWILDPSLAETLARMPWVADGVTDGESIALEDVHGIASKDIEFARKLASLPWFIDDMTISAQNAFGALVEIASYDLETAKRAASLSWLADGITQDEGEALHALYAIFRDLDTELGKTIARLPWFIDDLDKEEFLVVIGLRDITYYDRDIGEKVARFPWFADDITEDERRALLILNSIAHEDIKLAKTIARLPWFADDITEDERGTLDVLSTIPFNDHDLGKTVASLPWLKDDITRYEWDALQSLNNIALVDAELGQMVVSLPWFTDGVMMNEVDAIRSLDNIANINIDLAFQLAAYVTNQTRDLKFYVVDALYRIATKAPDTLGWLARQSWYADGLNEEESVFVVSLGASLFSTKIHNNFVQTHFTQNKRVSLPLAGDVNIWVFQDEPFPPDEDLLPLIEDTLHNAERFLGAPFPTTDIFLLIVSSEYGIGGFYNHTHMVAGRNALQSIPHETAHYYFDYDHFEPFWLVEGGADFIAYSYRNYRAGLKSIADSRLEASMDLRLPEAGCVRYGIENIRHYQFVWKGCGYTLGEHFLLSIFETIGEEPMSAAVSELYLQSRDSGRPATEEVIYNTFMKHAPTDDKKEELRGLYQTLHGGAFTFDDVDFDDDHGDEAATASEIVVGESVEGTLDYMFDFDYFTFQAEEDQKYSITVNHESLGASSVTLYDPDGQTQGRWKSLTREPSGPRMQWLAPSSDEYYVAVQNFGGKTGGYTLTVTPLSPIEDDHGDDIASATSISLGEFVQGTIDDDFDYDYFQFQSVEGERYRVVTEPSTLDYHHLHLFAAEGVPHHFDYGFNYEFEHQPLDNILWGNQTVIGELTAPTSGPFYLAIDGADGSVGSYTITVTPVEDVGE